MKQAKNESPKMDASAAITLISDNPVLKTAIPSQLTHTQTKNCAVVEHWQDFAASLRPAPPALAIVDCTTCADNLPDLAALRTEHPLMALIGIGTAQEAEYFATLALSSFITFPLAMPALLHNAEHLLYERTVTAGQQVLAFPMQAEFSAADKAMRRDGTTLELTDKETAMLLCLYHHRHGWLARQQLLEDVWGYSDSITTHTLETHLYRLRTKLREMFGDEDIVVTKQGAYQLRL